MSRRFLSVGLLVALAFAAPAAAKPVPLSKGSATLSFGNEFGLALVSLGAAPGVIAPATQDGVEITTVVHGGSAGPRKSTVKTRGGFALEDEADGVTLDVKDLVFVIRGKTVSVRGFAVLAGIDTDSFEFAKGKARTVVRSARGIGVRGAALKLTDIGSVALNSQFGAKTFKTGARVGTIRLTATR